MMTYFVYLPPSITLTRDGWIKVYQNPLSEKGNSENIMSRLISKNYTLIVVSAG